MGSQQISTPWWQSTTVYQIYPRSFLDTNNDGIGDIDGIIKKLDYLKELGIETIWISPMYASPQRDFGYDVKDYFNLSPEYGNLVSFEKLLIEAHKRGLKIIHDLLLNHTSNQHPWFQESRSSKTNPKRDWYIWKPGAKPGGRIPPNNWKSIVGGSAWHYDSTTDEWYLAQFLDFQPDLNYRNPDVKKAIFEMVRWWLRRGLDGFRLDMINSIYEDNQFRNNPLSWRFFPNDETTEGFFQRRQFTINIPETFEFAKELRAVLDEFTNPDRFLVGEVSGPVSIVNRFQGDIIDGVRTNGLHSVFLFKSLRIIPKAKPIQNMIREFNYNFPFPRFPTYVFSNHDCMRRITRIGGDHRLAKLHVAFQLTVRGIPFIYYGEEIGMQNHHFQLKSSKDSVMERYNWIPQWIYFILTKILNESVNRDECRTPMQWNSTENAGFCSSRIESWLPVHPNYHNINLEKMQSDLDSIWYCYQRFLQLRKKELVLQTGELDLIHDKSIPSNVVAYKRYFLIQNEDKKEILMIYLNFSKKSVKINHLSEKITLLASTLVESHAIKKNKLELSPYEGIVVRINEKN